MSKLQNTTPLIIFVLTIVYGVSLFKISLNNACLMIIIFLFQKQFDLFPFTLFYISLRVFAGISKFQNCGKFILNMLSLDWIKYDTFTFGLFLTSITDVALLFWIYYHQSIQTFALLAVFILTQFSLFFQRVLEIYFLNSFSISELLKKKTNILKFLIAYILGFIHLISFIMLIYLNLRYKMFAFILIIQIVLFTTAKKYSKYKRNSNFKKYTLIYLYHIIIDPRDFIYNQKIFEYKHKHEYFFDRNAIFSLIMKISHLFVFALHYNDNLYKFKEIYSICQIVFIVSIISILHLVYKVMKNLIRAILFGSGYIKFRSIQDFINESNYKRSKFGKNKDNNKQLQFIKIRKNESYQSILDKKEYLELLLFNYSKSSIKSSAGSRYYEGQSQVIDLYGQNYSLNYLLEIIGEKQVLKEIKQIYLNYSDTKENIIALQKLSENNVGVHFEKPYNYLRTKLQQIDYDKFNRVQQVCAQYKAQEKYLFKSQLINPAIIFYDLYENVIL